MTKNNPGHIHSAHLSSNDLLRYHRRLFSEHDRSLIEKHLNECDLCSDAMKGIAEMNDAMHIYSITHDLKKRMKKRLVSKKTFFSKFDLLTILSLFLIIGLILFLAFYFLVVYRW